MSAPVGSLCSGYSGLELGLSAVLDAHPAWFAEFDPAAAKVLAHHWPDVPNHGDLTTTDWSTVEPVDVLTAGWPCQPWSTAGRRKGEADERAIWPGVAAAVRDLRPRLVVLENVAAIAAAGELARAVGDLAAIGYDAVWCCVRAADVGAPHRRERIFIVAADAGCHARPEVDTHRTPPAGRDRGTTADTHGDPIREQPVTLARCSGEAVAGRAGDAPADPAGVGWGQGRPEPTRLVGGSDAAQRGNAAPDADGEGLGCVRWEQPQRRDPDRRDSPHRPSSQTQPTAWAGYAPAINRWAGILGRPAPAPTVLGKRGGRQLSPAFVEWLMGLPAGWVTDVPGLSRNQQLKLLGNGVVWQQAAAALSHLLPLLTDNREVA